MNKGKELLVSIISSYQDKLSSVTNDKYLVNGVDLVQLQNNIKTNKYYLANVTDDVIDEIIKQSKYKSHIIFIKKLHQLRDLYIGKNEYNINIEDKDDYNKTIDTFLSLIKIILDENKIIDKDLYVLKMHNLMNQINKNEVIDDQEFIEYITKEYNLASFDNNMLVIMEYITKHNYNILNNDDQIELLERSSELNITEISDELRKLLLKLDIDYNELPIEEKLAIKETDEEVIKERYNLIRHNKVEDYGILHFIDRSNNTAKLSILLYSSVNTIKSVVETFRDTNGEIDVNSLKKLINVILPVFISKDNVYYKDLYYNYINNIELFKKLDINILGLLNKCPLLFIVDHEKLTSTLNYFNKYKVEKKKIINKLYKVISIYPEQVSINTEILKKYIKIDDYLAGNNLNLLKVVNLEEKIKYLELSDNPDEMLNRIIKQVYDNQDKYAWGETND
jgi:hypothetical protein